MDKLLDMLEANKGSSLIYYIENGMYFANSQVEQYSYVVEGDDITFYQGNETELIAFKINVDAFDSMSFNATGITIIFDNGTFLLLEMI